MSNIPQAFPVLNWEQDGDGNVAHYQQEGMTLRDYFAAQVICGLMARAGAPDPRYESRLAYEVADAMLQARAAHQATKEPGNG